MTTSTRYFRPATAVLLCLAFSAAGAALDINSSHELRYFPGDDQQFGVDTAGEITAYGDLNLQDAHDITNLNQIDNFFGSCSTDEAVQEINDDGTFDCEPVGDDPQNLSDVLTQGNVANQSIDMQDNTLEYGEGIQIGDTGTAADGAEDVAIGADADASGGEEETAVGYAAEATEDYTQAFGAYAADDNEDWGVTAAGWTAARYNTGERLTAMGYFAGRDNAGDHVTGLGAGAAFSNEGDLVTTTGFNAGNQNEGDQVTATGYFAANDNIGNETAVSGYYAGAENTGERLTAMGSEAGRQNEGDRVTGTGYYAARGNTGERVAGHGAGAALSNEGDWVTAAGFNAARWNTGDHTTALGYYAADQNHYDNTIALGAWSNTTAEGAVAIGHNAVAPNAYEATFGNLDGNELDVNVTGDATVHEDLDVGGDTTLHGPLSVESPGAMQVANGLELTDTSSNTIESYDTLYLETSSGSPSDIVLDPSGEVGIDSNLDMADNNITSAGTINPGGGSTEMGGDVEITGGDLDVDGKLTARRSDDHWTAMEVENAPDASGMQMEWELEGAETTYLYRYDDYFAINHEGGAHFSFNEDGDLDVSGDISGDGSLSGDYLTLDRDDSSWVFDIIRGDVDQEISFRHSDGEFRIEPWEDDWETRSGRFLFDYTDDVWRFEDDLDMDQNEVTDMVVDQRSSDPSDAEVGQMWYREDLD